MKREIWWAFAFLALPLDVVPEAHIAAPERDAASPELYVDESSRTGIGDYTVSTTPGVGVTGFDFTNRGANRVVPVREEEIGMGPLRTYTFDFRTRARQDIRMAVTDTPTEFLSQRMESYFYFFPRRVLPAILWPAPGTGAKTFTVVLPTEEKLEFNVETKEVVSGVWQETAPIDLGPDRFKRKFAAVKYTGTGVMIRVDKRGGDPRLGTTAVIQQGDKTCKVSSTLLFDQRESSAVLFNFATDEEFNAFLIKQCKFRFL